MKLGQLLSTRLAEIPPIFALRLSTLQDAVRVRHCVLDVDTIRRELGNVAASRFLAIEPAPFAAGSAAVVFRAKMTDGTYVAIKRVHPSGQQETALTIECAHLLLSIVSKMRLLSQIPLMDAFDDIATAMLRQFDMRQEARLTEKVRCMFSNDRRIRVPRVYTDLSHETMLTLELINGLEKVTPATDGVAIEVALKAGFQALFRMILEQGLVHCDFHAGNVFFSRDGLVTVLDMGFMEELTPVETYQFREFFIGIMLNDGMRCVRVLLETAQSRGSVFDERIFAERICKLVSSRSRVKASDFKVVKFVHELFRIQSECGVRGSHRFTMTILALLVYEGMAAKLVPDIDFQREAIPVLGPILVRRGF